MLLSIVCFVLSSMVSESLLEKLFLMRIIRILSAFPDSRSIRSRTRTQPIHPIIVETWWAPWVLSHAWGTSVIITVGFLGELSTPGYRLEKNSFELRREANALKVFGPSGASKTTQALSDLSALPGREFRGAEWKLLVRSGDGGGLRRALSRANGHCLGGSWLVIVGNFRNRTRDFRLLTYLLSRCTSTFRSRYYISDDVAFVQLWDRTTALLSWSRLIDPLSGR